MLPSIEYGDFLSNPTIVTKVPLRYMTLLYGQLILELHLLL
jgi:hypothetical protein